MRKEFALAIEKETENDSNCVFITGDLGFMALESVRKSLGKRFVNGGISEQNIISLAAGMASKGLTVICYSIAPFIVFRPAEQIRLDVCLHNMNVKIVGNGGGYGYGIMGATHHAIEDIAVLSSFQNMTCFIPFCNEDVEGAVKAMMAKKGPAYLRLGFGSIGNDIKLEKFASVRKILTGDKITAIAMGPVGLNLIKAVQTASLEGSVDMFAVSEMPQLKLDEELERSARKSGKVLVIEEHVSRGGLGENISLLLLKKGVNCSVTHKCASGYPDGLYGSQSYHQKVCGLDAVSLEKTLKELLA